MTRAHAYIYYWYIYIYRKILSSRIMGQNVKSSSPEIDIFRDRTTLFHYKLEAFIQYAIHHVYTHTHIYIYIKSYIALYFHRTVSIPLISSHFFTWYTQNHDLNDIMQYIPCDLIGLLTNKVQFGKSLIKSIKLNISF